MGLKQSSQNKFSIYRRKLRETNVLAMSFSIMISWQSCGNVLAGGLQRLMTYVWVYRVINCVFFRLFLYLSISFTQTTSFFSVAVENFLSLLKNMIKSISFDIFPQTLILILEIHLRNIREFRLRMIHDSDSFHA